MSALKIVRSVWFDLDDTLYDFQGMMRRALRVPLEQIHQVYPYTKDILDVEALVKVREEVAQRYQGAAWSLEEMRLLAFRETLERYAEPNEALANKLQQRYLTARFADTKPYPDVLPCLLSLQSKFVLGLLSNGNSRASQIGLASFFTFSVLSDEVGIRKPDIGIFAQAAQLAGNRPEQCLYIGDSPKHDVAGAVSAGWQAVWLNRERKQWPLHLPVSPVEIASLDMLPLLLDQ